MHARVSFSMTPKLEKGCINIAVNRALEFRGPLAGILCKPVDVNTGVFKAMC